MSNWYEEQEKNLAEMKAKYGIRPANDNEIAKKHYCSLCDYNDSQNVAKQKCLRHKVIVGNRWICDYYK